MAKLSSAELAKREDVIMKMKKNKRSLVKRYGPDAEKVMYGRATNIAKKVAESEMEKTNLKELVRAALMNEKKKSFPDLTGDGKVTKADILKGRGIELKEGPEDRDWATYVKSLVNDIRLNGVEGYVDYSEDDFIVDYEEYIGGKMVGEDYDPDQAQLDDEDEIPMSYDDEGKPLGLGEDLDLGHEDDEPHMIKSELYRIGKYSMELYQMVDQFEGEGEVDFPAWWQAKITTAKNMVSSAKHYLEFELKEPEIDAMVGVATGEDIIPNIPSVPLEDEIEEGLPKGYFKKATAELDESFEKLVGKLKKQGKSEKAAKAIAGAVANYKAKGGGKGPTAKQKVKEGLFGNNFKKVDTIEYSGYEMDVWSDGKEKLIGHPRKKGQKSSAEEYNSEKFLGYSLDKLNQLKTAIDYMNSGKEDFNFPLYKKKFNNPNFVTTKVDVG
jgi:hypothetical protein